MRRSAFFVGPSTDANIWAKRKIGATWRTFPRTLKTLKGYVMHATVYDCQSLIGEME
jgi:hypothetical protein